MARQAGRVHGGDERWRWRRSGASSTQAPGGAADRADMHPLLQPLDGRRRSHGPDAFVLRRRHGGAKMVKVPILGSDQSWPRQCACPVVSVPSSSAIKQDDLRSEEFQGAAGAQPRGWLPRRTEGASSCCSQPADPGAGHDDDLVAGHPLVQFAVSESATSALASKSRRRRADMLRRASAALPARCTLARQGDTFATITLECTSV